MQNFFYSFNDYLKEKYGQRVQRLSLNAGLSCPKRDHSSGKEGCIFCNEKGFSPFAATSFSLKKQIDCGTDFAKKRYKAGKFIAYFQNATNTNGAISKLRKAYDVIKNYPDIIGLNISTRPDCINEKKLDLIESYSDKYEVWIEYGLQSSHERSLKFINRGHTYHDFVRAVEMTAKRKIKIGAHVILGLPGENMDDMNITAEKIAKLPVNGVKLHLLHVLKDTKLEKYYKDGKIKLMKRRAYVKAACSFLERISPECVVFRLISDAKADFLIAPKWMNEKSEVIRLINNEFKKRGTKQGYFFKGMNKGKDENIG